MSEASSLQVSVTDTMSRLASAGSIVLSGVVVSEAADAVTLQIGASLFDVPKQHIRTMREIDAGSSAGKTVEVSVANNAQLLQRTIATPYHAIAAASGLVLAAACQCACACDCACGGGSHSTELSQQATFRLQMPRSS